MEVEGKNKEDTGKECQVELSNGNLQTLHTNDLVVGALGDRFATNEVVGTWQLIGSETNENHHPDNTVMNMLCGSGIFGIETSRCSKHPQSPKFIYEGHCLRFNNEKICMKDFASSSTTTLLRDYIPNCPIILIVGSSMDSGKTYAGEQIIRMIKHDDLTKKRKLPRLNLQVRAILMIHVPLWMPELTLFVTLLMLAVHLPLCHLKHIEKESYLLYFDY
eukprot:200834_1